MALDRVAVVSSPLPEKAADTTPESPWPVRTLSMKVGDYVDRMSPLWVEGQIVQLRRRPGAPTCFLTLRDTEVDMSFSVTVHVNTLDAMGPAVREGARVVVHCKPTFWGKRGSLQLQARQMRAVGVGELLARLEHLKSVLRSEGLFDASRKRPLPFIPGTIGLVCGRASAAEKDVVENARRRWPSARFAVRQVAVQGQGAVADVTRALQELDADRQIDVIVISRGGGSLEDLLPFSNETLLRAVSAASTPVVSAIGHDVDTPLLDFVADVRASTPTDAAKLIVPSLEQEQAGLTTLMRTGARALQHRVVAERRHLEQLSARPVLAHPEVMVDGRREDVDRLVDRQRRHVAHRLDRAHDEITHLTGRVRSLSPLRTLQRGYAVVRHTDGALVTNAADVEIDELLRVTVAEGDFGVRPVSSSGVS